MIPNKILPILHFFAASFLLLGNGQSPMSGPQTLEYLLLHQFSQRLSQSDTGERERTKGQEEDMILD